MEILFKDGKKSWILNEVQGLQQQLLSSLLSCNAFHLTPPTCFDSCFSKCVLLQNVTKCYNFTLPGSYVHTYKPFSMVIMSPFMLHLVSPPRWNVLRYTFGANLPYIAVVYIGNPGLWSVWKSFLWWRSIEHLLSCKMQKTLLCCQRCISPVEGLPAENAKWMDKDCQVPQIKSFPLLLYFPSCAIPIIFNHISRVNRSTVRQWLSK